MGRLEELLKEEVEADRVELRRLDAQAAAAKTDEEEMLAAISYASPRDTVLGRALMRLAEEQKNG